MQAASTPSRDPDRLAAPRAGAEGAIAAFWELTAPGGVHRVLPDGCIDFLVDLDAGRGRVVGTMTRAEVLVLPAGARFFGVRFRPGAATQFLTERAGDLTDREAGLEELGFTAGPELAERLAGARSHAERRRIALSILGRGEARKRPPDGRVLRAARRIEAARGAVAVASVAVEIGVGERQLERLFAEHVGVGPKLLARVARLQHAASLLGTGGTTQAALAAACGYADEAHLLRDFRALAGATPRILAAERRVGFVRDEPAPGPHVGFDRGNPAAERRVGFVRDEPAPGPHVGFDRGNPAAERHVGFVQGGPAAEGHVGFVQGGPTAAG